MYTQHVPRLVSIITNAIEGKLKPELFRYSIGPTAKEKPQDIIVFVVGGTTYGEAMHINKLSQQWPGVRIILGGTCIHNSKSFVEQVSKTIKNYKNALRDPKTPINLNTVDKSARLA